MKNQLLRAAARIALAEPTVRLLARGAAPGLDRQIAGMLRMYRLMGFKAMDSMSVADARAYSEGDLSPLDATPAEMAKIVDTQVAGVPARIYTPKSAGPHTLVWFHGGGGAIGSIAGSDAVVRLFAELTRCTVASIGYRLGPEHKHPAAIEDACAAFGAVAREARGKLVVGGDSFGGFLSAHVEHDTRVRGTVRPAVQVLAYPMVDLTMSSPSVDRLADGYVLTRSLMHWFRDHYTSGPADFRPGSPMFWSDLAGASPCVISTAGFDPLVDEGIVWADRLKAAGVTVRHHHEAGLIHGFLNVTGGIRAARRAAEAICADVVGLLT